MKKAFWFSILLLSSFMLLLVSPIKTKAGDFIDGALVITEGSEQEVSPSIAYNSQRHEYLAVWYNDRAGCDDVRAQRISTTGALIGGPFYISAGCTPDRRFPDVAYNTVHDQYLVVWEQYDISSGYSIMGRRVSGSGQVLDTADIEIRGYGAGLYTPTKPAVSYASTSDRYLVVWGEVWHSTIIYDIYGQVVGDTGPVNSSSRFPISTGSEIREEPDVAYNRHANRYLVVWQQKDGATYDIYGQQVHGGGGLYQSTLTLAYLTVSTTKPAVAALPTTPTNDKFLVVWELLYSANNHDIFGKIVKEDGTMGTGDYFIADNAVDETAPAITASEDNLKYFVTCRSPQGVVDNPINGLVISYTGIAQGNIIEFSGVAATNPALAAGPAGDILAIWQDQPISATNDNIYGQLWGNRLFLPLILRN